MFRFGCMFVFLTCSFLANAQVTTTIPNYPTLKVDSSYSMNVYVNSNEPQPFLIDLNNYCYTEAKILIDLFTNNVPDKFLITTLDSTLIASTPYFGFNCSYVPDSLECVQGFVTTYESFYTVENTTPNDFEFNYLVTTSLAKKCGRIEVWTPERQILFWIHPNQFSPTIFRFYMHPTEYTEAARPHYEFVGTYTCDENEVYEYEVANGSVPCDTVFIHGVRFTEDVVNDFYDTIKVPVDKWYDYDKYYLQLEEFAVNDTTFFKCGFNRDGCEYCHYLHVHVYDNQQVYIPNIVSLKGNFENRRFKPFFKEEPDKIRIQIFDRYGGVMYDGATSWIPKEENIGVYVYLITAWYNGEEYYFSGDVTLVK